MEEAADVGAPVRHAREARVEPQRELRLERREIVVDVARPARRAEALHARRAGPAQEKHALIRAVGRLALRERLVAEAVVDVVEQRPVATVELGGGRRALAAVEPPARDAELPQMPVGGPPPPADLGPREVEVALALAVGGRGPAARADALVARGQEVAARLRFGEERRVLV